MLTLIRWLYKELPSYEKTAANTITIGRLYVAVAALVCWAFTPHLILLIVVAAMMLLDNVDGWVARRYGMSEFGKQFDPIVDKVVMIVAISALAVRMVIDPVWVFVAVITFLAYVELSIALQSSKMLKQTGRVPDVTWQGKRGMFFRNCSVVSMMLYVCGNDGVYQWQGYWRTSTLAIIGAVLGLIARKQYSQSSG